MGPLSQIAFLAVLVIPWASAQNLPTTCPVVRAAKCMGMCSAPRRARQLLEQRCENGICSSEQQEPEQQLRHLTATASSPKPSTTPQESVTPTVLSTTGTDPSWWGSKGPSVSTLPPNEVPQRVLPDRTQGIQPPESEQTQQNIVQKLNAIYSSSPAPSATAAAVTRSTPAPPDEILITEAPLDASGAVTTSAVTFNPITSQASIEVTAHLGGSSKAPTAAAVEKPYSGPDSMVKNRKLTFLANSKIKIGLDMERAGVITWVSSPLMPGFWKDRNMINIWDQGRLLQQSFYGCVDGSCWATRPWLWNPVQGGSWENFPGLTTKQQVVAGKYLYVEGYGRNWGKEDLIKDLLLSTNATLKDNYAEISFAAKYTGSATHPYMTQEVPALFVDRRFSVLAYYDGKKPWTNDVVKYAFPGGRNIYARPTEMWAAYIDPDTGYGLGIFNPKAWMGITAYRIGDRDDDVGIRPWFVSYVATTIRMQLHPQTKTYAYKVWVVPGTVAQIRAAFYKLKAMPGVMPTSTARGGAVDMSVGDPTLVTRETEGQPDLGRNAYYGDGVNYTFFNNIEAPGRSADTVAPEPDSTTTTPPEADTAQGASTSASSSEQNYVKTGEAAGDAPQGAASKGGAGGRAASTIGIVIGAVAGTTLLAGAAVLVKRLQARRAAETTRAVTEAQPANASNGLAKKPAAGAKAAANGNEVVATVSVDAKTSESQGPKTRSTAALG